MNDVQIISLTVCILGVYASCYCGERRRKSWFWDATSIIAGAAVGVSGVIFVFSLVGSAMAYALDPKPQWFTQVQAEVRNR